MRFIYSGDDPELTSRNPAQNRIYVTGLGSICAFYEETSNGWPPALRIFGVTDHSPMQIKQLIHDLEAGFARQMGFEHNRQAFDALEFADLITLTRAAEQARQDRNRELNIQPEGVFERCDRQPRRRLSSRQYHEKTLQK